MRKIGSNCNKNQKEIGKSEETKKKHPEKSENWKLFLEKIGKNHEKISKMEKNPVTSDEIRKKIGKSEKSGRKKNRKNRKKTKMKLKKKPKKILKFNMKRSFNGASIKLKWA